MRVAHVMMVEMITKGVVRGPRYRAPRGILDRRERLFRASYSIGLVFPGFTAQAVVENTARTGGTFHHERKPGNTIDTARERLAVNIDFESVGRQQGHREEILILGIRRYGQFAFLL